MPSCCGKGGTFKGHPSCLVKVCSIPCRHCPCFTPQPKHHLVLLNVLYFSKTQRGAICISLASSSTKIQWETGEKCQENIQVLRRTWHAQPSPVFLGGPNPCVQARHSACRQVPLALLAQTYHLPSCHVFVSPGHFQPLCRVEHISPDCTAGLSLSLSPHPWSSLPATSPSWPTTLFGALS